MAMQNKNNQPAFDPMTLGLWIGSAAFLFGLIFARAAYPDLLWLTAVLSILLILSLAGLIRQNIVALKTRTAAFGFQSIITTALVIALIGVLNFFVAKNPMKVDLTKNKVHTLSDQTVKLVKGLSKPIKFVVYTSAAAKEQVRPLLDNYHDLNASKVEIEYIDPNKEPTRAKAAGIKKLGTLVLQVNGRENKIEDATEEKLTNALIKLQKDKAQTLCTITGHGEKNMAGADADGYDSIRKALLAQSYEVKDLATAQESKIPDFCDAIAIVGATKSFFDPEIKAILAYLANGGRAIIAVDVNVTGGPEYAPELLKLLEQWNVRAAHELIVDPLSRSLGVDAAVPILAAFSKENPIAKDFQDVCYFPFTRPLEILPGAPDTLKVQWLAQTTNKSWGETDFKELASGQVKMDPGQDKPGPLHAAVTIDGKLKDSKAPRNTRMVVFGTSSFANNNYSRRGNNLDIFVNSASWVLEDESLISIRSKDDANGKVEISDAMGSALFILLILVIPALVLGSGILVWIYRKRL